MDKFKSKAMLLFFGLIALFLMAATVLTEQYNTAVPKRPIVEVVSLVMSFAVSFAMGLL